MNIQFGFILLASFAATAAMADALTPTKSDDPEVTWILSTPLTLTVKKDVIYSDDAVNITIPGGVYWPIAQTRYGMYWAYDKAFKFCSNEEEARPGGVFVSNRSKRIEGVWVTKVIYPKNQKLPIRALVPKSVYIDYKVTRN